MDTLREEFEEREMVDVVTGEKTIIRSLRHTADLDSGDMHFYLLGVEYRLQVNDSC
ncbi:TPA: hypothetical protein ACS26J_005156 [Serratia marcescens]